MRKKNLSSESEAKRVATKKFDDHTWTNIESADIGFSLPTGKISGRSLAGALLRISNGGDRQLDVPRDARHRLFRLQVLPGKLTSEEGALQILKIDGATDELKSNLFGSPIHEHH